MAFIQPGKSNYANKKKKQDDDFEADLQAAQVRTHVPASQQKKTFVSLKEFVEQSFSMHHKLPMNWHHELYYDILDDQIVQGADGLLYPADKLSIKKHNKNIIVQSPRFHAKSQCFTTNYALYELYKNPNARIMIVSANQEIAVGFVRQIMNNLENNHEMIDKFGDLKPADDIKKWGEKAFQVARDSFDKDPSVVGLGAGGKIISRRADVIIVDDLLDMDNARTPSMRAKTLEWFENVVLPVLEDTGRLVIVGTSWYRDDLYSHLMSHPSFDIKLKLKALMYHPKYIRQDRGEVRFIPYKLHEFPQALDVGTVFSEKLMLKYDLYTRLKEGVMWPEKWSYAALMEKYGQMSSSSFMRQYLNEPMSEEEKVFKDETMKRTLDGSMAKTLVSAWDNMEDGMNHKFGYGNLIIAVGVDLAISQKKSADNSAIAVWGMDEHRRRILLYLEFGKWSPDEIKQRVLVINENFKPVKIVVENIAFQDMLRQDLEKDDLPIEGFHTTAGKKFSEETGIAQIAMLMEQNKVIIPIQQNPADLYKRVRQLVYEMSSYTYEQHAGDVLMASWLAFTALNDYDKKMKANRGFFMTTSLVEHFKNRRSENRILLLGTNPPVYRFAFSSLVHVYRDVDNPEFMKQMFIQPKEPFMIFATRKERSVAYILQKQTKEIVGKIEGMSISTTQLATLLEKAGQFFNNAQVVIDKNDEGEALLLEMQNRNYPDLMCMQPDKDGDPSYSDGFKITAQTLPLAIDHFKYLVDSIHIQVPDESLLKEMTELISVQGNEITIGYGDGQRIRTVATALWLLDNYENDAESAYNGVNQHKKERKTLKVPYRVFQ